MWYLCADLSRFMFVRNSDSARYTYGVNAPQVRICRSTLQMMQCIKEPKHPDAK